MGPLPAPISYFRLHRCSLELRKGNPVFGGAPHTLTPAAKSWSITVATGARSPPSVTPLQSGVKKGQPGIWGGPAYFDTGGQKLVYYGGNGGPLTAFVFTGISLALSTIGSNPNQSSQTFPH